MTFQIQTMSDSNNPLQANVEETRPARSSDPDEYLSLVNDGALLTEHMAMPTKGKVTFEVDGVQFFATHAPKNDTETKLIIWGNLGYLPYSLSNHEHRQNLITIMNQSCRLDIAKMGIDNEMKIVIMGRFILSNPLEPDYLFVPMVQFMQEARPYIKLVGEYL